MYFWSKHHFLSILENENNNNKNKMWATSWQNQLNSTLIRVLDVRMKKAWVFSYPLSAQADLSLRWTHSHFVGFVMRRLKWHYLLIFIYIIIYTRRTLSLFFFLSSILSICHIFVTKHHFCMCYYDWPAETQHDKNIKTCAPSEDSACAAAQSDQSLRCPHE